MSKNMISTKKHAKIKKSKKTILSDPTMSDLFSDMFGQSLKKDTKPKNECSIQNRFAMTTSKVLMSLEEGLSVSYMSNFIEKSIADYYFKVFEEDIEYNSDEKSQVIIGGKKILIPRKQVAFGDEGTFYNFSGNHVDAINWNSTKDKDIEKKRLFSILKTLRDHANMMTGEQYNFVLINRYKNGSDYVGYHSDDEKDLVKYPSITAFSFGASRVFQLKSKKNKKITHSLQVSHGSILTMHYPTNTNWLHSVPKRKGVENVRISLTFRQMKKAK